MKIGLTYDLREEYLKLGFSEEDAAEFDSPRTIEAIESAVANLGHETDRIGHIRSLVARLAAGERWDLVFNIAEGVGGFGREAQIPGILEAYNIPYTFADPLTASVTLHKGMAKRIVRDIGLPTPDFRVIEAENDLDDVNLPYPLFAKPVAEGTGKGVTAVSKIRSESELRNVCKRLLTQYRQPVLVETFLPGREFTVGILGSDRDAKVLGVMEIQLLDQAEPEVYSYDNKEHYLGRVVYRLADDATARMASQTALASYRGLGCRDAGRVDLRVDQNGIPNFMEVNPLAGLNPDHSDLPILCGLLGISYQELIRGIVESTTARVEMLDSRIAKAV